MSEAQQAAFLKLAYRCLSSYPYVRAALWFSARDVTQNDTELGRYGLERFDGSRRPAYDALSAVAHGGAGSGECGDFDAPRISVQAPTAGAVYDRSLLVRVAAHDDQSSLGRITFYANGRKIRSFTDGLRNDRPVEIDWMGARELPYGQVTVTVEALDEFGNTSTRDIQVRRVDPAAMPAQAPRVALRLSGRGLVRRVSGRVSAPGAAFQPGGKVVITWQYKRKGRWVTLHKRSKNANKPFAYAQRLRKAGRWRVLASYTRRGAVRAGAFAGAVVQRALRRAGPLRTRRRLGARPSVRPVAAERPPSSRDVAWPTRSTAARPGTSSPRRRRARRRGRRSFAAPAAPAAGPRGAARAAAAGARGRRRTRSRRPR